VLHFCPVDRYKLALHSAKPPFNYLFKFMLNLASRDSKTKTREKPQNQKVMQNIVNKVQLIGRLGMDPEIKKFDNGTTLARMSIATDASYKNSNGEKVEDTHWHTVVAWGKTAELAQQMLKKGKEVAIEGKLINRSYEDKDGKKRYTTEVQLVEFLKTEKKSA